MGTNHDEKIVEPTMKSRNTGLFDKIVKPAKMIKSWNPGPVSLDTTLKSYAHAQTMLLLKFAQYSQMFGSKRNKY